MCFHTKHSSSKDSSASIKKQNIRDHLNRSGMPPQVRQHTFVLAGQADDVNVIEGQKASSPAAWWNDPCTKPRLEAWFVLGEHTGGGVSVITPPHPPPMGILVYNPPPGYPCVSCCVPQRFDGQECQESPDTFSHSLMVPLSTMTASGLLGAHCVNSEATSASSPPSLSASFSLFFLSFFSSPA